MPISRDPRMDRRRRVLREHVDGEQAPPTTRSQRGRAEQTPDANTRRTAAYSQDVRGACGHRLVQLIPVRLRSYAAAVAASCLVPTLLLVAHYMIYVTGSWPWYGHPLVIALDASHPQGIAVWFSSHVWLLCLGATLLTFQLRKHKLDDYNGEYRLWFWLVITCLVASVDATTHLFDLFGLALNPWSQLNLGWSGPAVVRATLTVLIGMLGLRLCSELKTVPGSLIFWLVGLVAWAGSAALAQTELKVELTVQFRIWLRCALWLGGLTAVWLAALTYLRSIYIEAQQRFLLRSRATANLGIPLGRRLRESMPSLRLPSFRGEPGEPRPLAATGVTRGWKLPRLRRRSSDNDDTAPQNETALRNEKVRNNRSADSQQSSASQGGGGRDERAGRAQNPDARTLPEPSSGGWFQRKRRSAPAPSNAADETKRQTATPQPQKQRPTDKQTDDSNKSWWAFSRWIPKAKDDGEAAEFRKLRAVDRAQKREQAGQARAARQAEKQAEKRERQTNQSEENQAGARRSIVSRIGSLGRPRLPNLKRSGGGWLSRIKLPSLAARRLKPPEPNEASTEKATPRPVTSRKPLPGTSDSDEESNSNRVMTKAERKRMRRLQQQQQNRAA